MSAELFHACGGAHDAPHPPRIVVVDDDPVVLAVLDRVLARAGFDVVAFDHPVAVLAALDNDLDVVAMVSDYHLPVMSGADLAAQVRARHPGLPVLFVTGSSVVPDLVVTDPLVDLAVKPVHPARLVDQLSRLISDAGRCSHDCSTAPAAPPRG